MKKKINSKTIFLIIILLLLAGAVVWVLFFNKDNDTQLTDLFSAPPPVIEKQKLPSQEIFVSGLEQDSRWQNLQDYRDFNFDTSAKGRANPFNIVR